MTPNRSLLLVPLALLAGCGSSDRIEEKNASVGEVAKAVAKAGPEMKFKPGRWESKVDFVTIDAPNLPPELANAMKGAVGKNRVFASCLTKEQAEKPNADFFNNDAKNCTYEHFTMGGGKLDAKMVCAGSNEGRATVEMKGDYSPTRYTMAMSTRAEGGSGGAMTMTMKVESNHAGNCTGDESKAG